MTNVTEDAPVTTPSYQHVDPKYRTQLRLDAVINWGLLLIASLVALWWLPADWRWVAGVAAVAFLLILLFMIVIWAPRRYQLTGYAVAELDVHYRTGALWRSQTAVPVNRIQHVEISQGPVERLLGLSRLSLYTAGGAGSDLAVPGLARATATQIRARLLGLINEPDEG